MYRHENFRKTVKIFIVALLCSEMHLTLLTKNSKNNVIPCAYAAELNETYATSENSHFHASIRLTTLDDTFGEGHICSGALIAPSVVLTAAQCVFNYMKNSERHPAELKVVMGTQNRYQRMQHTLVYGVTHLYTPHTFDAMTLRDNIAILMLDRDVFENEHIKPITFKFEENTNTNDNNDEAANDFKVTSWMKNKKGAALPTLMLLNASIVDHILCHQNYDLICVNLTSLHANLCPSDVGAPLIFENQLIGLSSHGNDCVAERQPVVYSNLRRHQRWIMEKIGNGSNQNSSIWGTLAFLIFTAFVIKTANFKKRRSLLNF